ncbi:arginine--tRNA ligase, partial [Patescibacteria group bacterium]|nr:arginine--tRNA ligase [Patescibacteria group bacterium]
PEEKALIPKFEKARDEWKVVSRKVVDGRLADTREGRREALDLSLGVAKKKFEDLDLDLSIYVVADEQRYHFDVLFELLDRFNIVARNKNYHLSYGMVNLAEGKMSSRKGIVIKMDDLMDELHDMAKKEITQRDSDIGVVELEERAEKVSLAAMKFNLLNQDKNKVILFDKEKTLKFEGETGPYLLYTYARINSILEKYGVENFPKEFLSDNMSLENREMVVEISKFNEVIHRGVSDFNPAVLSKYLYNLAKLFNSFYHHYRILDAKTEHEKESRVILAFCVAMVLKIGLKLLGIGVLPKM